MFLPNSSTAVSVREIQLLRETLAAMRIRVSLPQPDGALNLQCEPVDLAGAEQADLKETMDPIRILCISDYDGLRVSRKLLLEREGYYAESVPSSTVIDPALALRFQMAILCDSVAQKDAQRVAQLLRCHHPGIRVVRVSKWGRTGDPNYDRELDCFLDPSQFLLAVREEVSRFLLRR